MKFNSIIHPEILLDKRGDPVYRKIYQEYLKEIFYSRDGLTIFKNQKKITLDKEIVKSGKHEGGEYKPRCFVANEKVYKLDENLRDHFLLCKKWKLDSGKIYHINRDFLLTLSQINREIPIDCLPERFLGYISFAPQTLKDDTGFIEGAYVFVGDAKETNLNEEEYGKKTFWCSYIEEKTLTVTALRITLGQKTMQELISELLTESGSYFSDYARIGLSGNAIIKSDFSKKNDLLEKRELIFRTLINSIIYIYCQNPILEKTRPITELTHSQREKIRSINSIYNDSQVPITFINWAYQQPVQYSKYKTQVSGHFRKQHHGPRNTLVKAIFIEEHERILNKDLNT